MDIKEFKNLGLNDLQNKLLELRKEAFKLRLKKASGDLAKSHLLRLTRRNIARIKTIIAQKAEHNNG